MNISFPFCFRSLRSHETGIPSNPGYLDRAVGRGSGHDCAADGRDEVRLGDGEHDDGLAVLGGGRPGVLYVGVWGGLMVAVMFPAFAPVAGLIRQKPDGVGELRRCGPSCRGRNVVDADRGVGYVADLGVQGPGLPGRFPLLKIHVTQISGELLTKPRRNA